ncbi:MAG: cob(I)yrinic acid a,c-diamide adenosyltransferase [Planctomycetes bacterium]|nr:cob(I)yrinic acid a,c-diamide adenosyltransferase [Planctomycetota bacterium]MCB9904559.1 cob(I)yrinic acid a,c-diamide adenosyltransferase [Planctomycetota bacterium]MCB9906055.1 cob(I)yrinic acid a,c-diamide adenosyltransferase [Planctomycetota bacterium]
MTDSSTGGEQPAKQKAVVRLNRISTKTGDDGTTGLGDGSRLPKHHPRIAAYGTLDELSSMLGVAIAAGVSDPHATWLRGIQNDLFDLGSDLCVPGEMGDKLRITADYTARLDALLDEQNELLEPLDSFCLPGGTLGSAWMHVARTVCRRAEREVSALIEHEPEGAVNREVMRYLNRLSDLLFVFGRVLNDGGKADIKWVPGLNKS